MEYSESLVYYWFYPDVAESAGFSTDDSKYAPAGQPANNDTLNLGLAERLGYVLNDAGETFSGVSTSPLSNLISKTELAKLYVSHISNLTTRTAGSNSPVVQYSVKATIMLKDIHPLFEVMPWVAFSVCPRATWAAAAAHPGPGRLPRLPRRPRRRSLCVAGT